VKRGISCLCDAGFSVEVPGEIDLDRDGRYLDEILDGSFLNFVCPRCGKKHKPEFPLTLRWGKKALVLEVLPEQSRGEFYRRKQDGGAGETVIGYPEMAERLGLYRDGLVPGAVEALKYHLLLRAEETWPGEELSLWYQGRGDAAADDKAPLEFHFHGFKSAEIAVSRLPYSLYEKTLAEFRARPRSGVFALLRFRSYLSVRNALRPETGEAE
jgi:hypothetical protein